MSVSRISGLAFLCSSFAVVASSAAAQEVKPGTTNTQEQAQLDPMLKPAHRKIESRERFFLELKGGPYTLFSGEKYSRLLDGDSGPSFAAQLEAIFYRLPSILYVTAGGSLGYMGYSGPAVSKETGEPTGEDTTLGLVPMTAIATVRVDALPRLLRVPVILAARVGFRWTHWDADTGKISDASGWSLGPVFSGQVAIDLDTFEPGGARALDEEWGINHTYLLGEITYHSTTEKSLPVGGTSWMLGLGVAF